MSPCRWSRSGQIPRSLIASFITVCVAATGVAAGQGPAAASAPQRVQPGATVSISGMQCKVGFLLHQGKKVYAAIPASCTAGPLDEGQHQDGCSAATNPTGSPARIAGARRPVTLVYDSFTRMQGMSKRTADMCYYNDLALLKLKPGDAKAARGRVPGTQSPSRVSHSRPANGSQLSDGHGSATVGSTTHDGWLYQLSTAPMVAASDVGTPFVQGSRLFGMLTQIPQGTVFKTQPGISNLNRALRIMRKSPRSRFHHLSFRHLKLLKAGHRA
jgi:hypothetical protein